LDRRTVLVVDDEELLRSFLSQSIGSLGVEVDGVCSGGEALDRIRRHPPDVVVTDLRLPGMSGLQLIEQARPIAPETAFIVITGFGTYGDAVTAGKLGAVEFLPKPFDADSIRAAVQRALEGGVHAAAPAATGTLELELSVPSDPGLRAGAYSVLERFAHELGVEFDLGARAALRFCVMETLLNAMQHGHRFERERRVRFRARLTADEVECEVEDQGEGYTPRPAEEGSGRGLALVRGLMDRTAVDRDGRRIRFARRVRAGDETRSAA
jgi:ActR/RegA family two-component response regulator/anti-sigma regulatory factor (Ser/Thr protein kinase)